ncbi:ATP-binding protein [Dyella sp. 20L07]|uniref:ATP-binding protein n=1 Tax=Dyella sp. 20L07 TaxID=3384240 RepID=UPI003D2B4722
MMRTDVSPRMEAGPSSRANPPHAAILSSLALPWIGTEAVSLPPVTLIVAAMLMVIAVLALALVWLLQAQIRKNKALQAQLNAQRLLHQETLDALPLPIVLHGLDGEPQAGNRRSQEVPGSVNAAVNAIQDDSFTEQKEAVLRGESSRQDIDYAANDGTTHAAHLWVGALRDDDGQPRGYASALLDITEFRDAEQDAKQTEQRLGDIAQRIPVVALVMRVDASDAMHLTFATGNTGALFHLEQARLRDRQGLLRIDALRERVHPDDLPAFAQLLSPRSQGAPVRTLDFRTFGQDGLRWIHATLATLRADDGSLRMMGYFIDTTEQNLRNDALRIARDVAERASKAKADFLATMSHEIRTPMNGVIGMLELLGRTSIDSEQRELLHAVEDSAGSLLQILNDILDFSKLEAGDLRLDIGSFDPRLWLDHAASTLAATARKKGVDLRVSVDAGVAGQLRGDGLRLRQILLNLLSNAIKFTDRGSVTARLVVLGDSGTHQQLSLSVTDTGIGIAQDKQATLFKPFAQAETWTSRRYGGTGLGLAICSQLVELMDGSIQLTSEVDVGTNITVELRLPIVERTTESPAELRGRHAVVRLASTVVASMLEEHLRAAGMTVERVAPTDTLREGMAASLLFVDIHDRESESGISAHVVNVTDDPLPLPGAIDGPVLLSAQPLKWRSVLRACMRALELELDEPDRWHDAFVDTRPPATPTTAPLAPPAIDDLPVLRGHILVAEDHPVSQRLIARQLALLGLNCDIVDNGRDAYEALTGDSYALLLTDCNMPQMSGYELAQAWRLHEQAIGARQRLPILAMTANALSSETARAKDAGMDDVLSKPLQLAALSQKLHAWLPGAERSAISTNGHAATQPELQRLFTEVSEADLRQLSQHTAQRDATAAAQVLHRLLGVLPLFADETLLDKGQRLFEALHETDGESAWPELGTFAQQVAQLLATLDRPHPSL